MTLERRGCINGYAVMATAVAIGATCNSIRLNEENHTLTTFRENIRPLLEEIEDGEEVFEKLTETNETLRSGLDVCRKTVQQHELNAQRNEEIIGLLGEKNSMLEDMNALNLAHIEDLGSQLKIHESHLDWTLPSRSTDWQLENGLDGCYIHVSQLDNLSDRNEKAVRKAHKYLQSDPRFRYFSLDLDPPEDQQ